MDEINEKNVKKPDENQIINKFGNLVAVSAIASKSPSLMDRLSHALSPNIILETIYECLRIYNSGIRSGDIIILKREKNPNDNKNQDTGKYAYIFIKTDFKDKEKTARIKNYIPGAQDIEDLLIYVQSDRDLGKKIAVYALTMVNNNYSKMENDIEEENDKKEVVSQ
jgi:CRISPR type I-A-associated protein Csa5